MVLGKSGYGGPYPHIGVSRPSLVKTPYNSQASEKYPLEVINVLPHHQAPVLWPDFFSAGFFAQYEILWGKTER